MKTQYYIITLTILLSFNIACKKKCKEDIKDTYMSASQLDWIPFSGNETVIFEDSNGNEISFIGEGYDKTPPYVDDKNCPDKYSEVVNLSFSSSQVEYTIRYTLRFWSGTHFENEMGLELILLDDTREYSNAHEDYLPYAVIEITDPTYSSKTINSRTFNDVYEFNGDYMTLYYNKEYGIIGLNEGSCCSQQDLKIWNLKN